MLFHRLEANSSGVDVEQCFCELREEIDPACFERAWQEAMARHAILRTSFGWESGDAPRQIVHSAAQVRLRFHYVEFDGVNEGRRGLEDYLASDRREGFPTLEAPLLRVALLKAGAAHCWWVATFHHLLLDGRALVVLFKEVHDLHDAFVAGRTPELPAVSDYRNYIDWLQTLDTAAAQAFWREQLEGLSAPTLLPIARTGLETPDTSDARGELAFRLSETTTNALRDAAKLHQVTMNTLVQAAWAIVLSRYTGEDDVVFGAVRACRHIPVEGAGSIVGMFINTVPIRVRVPAPASLGPWLRSLREQWVALRDYEHTPLMRVQQWSEIAPGRPLFETLFNYQDPSWDTALRQLGGKWASREFDIRSQPNYPLAVDAYGGAAILVKMLYDRARFTDEAIVGLLGHYRTVLEALGGARDGALAELPLLTNRESEQVLIDWNRTAIEYPGSVCVHRLVEAHAQQSPERVAVSDAKTSLTYGELNARANQLARRLQQLGVRPDTLVAVCMERSSEMLVAWLAALKAGGAFVPLDPKYPAERLAFQLEDCRAPVLLTQPQLRAALPAMPASVTLLELPPGGDAFPEAPASNLGRGGNARHLAYVIYTSGSTGQPKGVQIEHRALMNLVTWHQRAYAITPAARGSQLASPAFDASVWEVWPYLTAGASVHIPEEETRLSPALLWRWFAEKKITVAFVPTPLAEILLSEPWPTDLSLRALLTGGDKLKRRPPADFPCALINHYGPTENTVVATCGVVSAPGPAAVAPAIGRPIANTQCYILDRHLRPVPVGVPGELHIGGDSLARGYWNRPDLTAEKFITLPFSALTPPGLCHIMGDKGPDVRLYRTGDLVRWTSQGDIEFLGRLDNQVKIRGCRIELGEIEAALQSHPSVREGLVVARADEHGQMQLVAYATLQPDAAPMSDVDVREFLRAKLPAYMVPSAVVFLDTWPLTQNGKIDRGALPMPSAPLESAAAFAAPHTPQEEAIARVWSELLGRSPVGRHDNFFALGGHSLLAAQVVSRLNQAFQSRLTVRAVFDQPTVAALAREVEAKRGLDLTPPPLTQRLKRRAPRAGLEILQPN